MRGGGEFEGKKAKWPLTPAHALKVKKNKGGERYKRIAKKQNGRCYQLHPKISGSYRNSENTSQK